MLIQEMTESECLTALGRTRIGRLASAHDNQPYVVPIYFVYESSYLYGVTTPGQKVEWMRTNPLVCVELDEIVNGTQWMSIVIFGRYEELPDNPEDGERWNHHRALTLQGKPPDLPKNGRERRHAHELLQKYTDWWEPGVASTTFRNAEQPLAPLYYRIRIDKITGRRATPSPSRPITSRKPTPGRHAGLVRVFHALFKLLTRWRGMRNE
jgi:nitroimidazol reductase NimA-like FMN-containing flavoprotein (pyridoxamine 5'-phosphate oxidase superfamily)